jgi:hypothetical protein
VSSRSPLDRVLAELREREPPVPTAVGLPPALREEFRRLSDQRALMPARRSVPPRRPVLARRGRGAARRWWPALALVPAAALALLLLRPQSGAPPSPTGAAALAQLDGQPLELGAVVVATDRPRHVEHRGRASWELAPGSRARLASNAGNVLRISLEQGSLDAEVQPSAAPESFIVMAAGTEVAVHGTRFRVTLLDGEHVRVAVSQGVVQVRPVSAGAARASGTSLAAGAQADFWAGLSEPAAAATPAAPTAPAAPLAPERSRPEPELSAPPAHAAPAPPAGKPASTPAPAGAARHPAAQDRALAPPVKPAPAAAGAAPPASVQEALQAVTEQVQACFRRELQGSIEVGIEVSTTLALGVEPDGTLLSADFDPPLAPAVERCVAAQLAHLRVAASPDGYRVERNIRLRR